MNVVFLNTFSVSGGAAIATNRIYSALKDQISITGISQFEKNNELYYKHIKYGKIRFAIEKLEFLPLEKNKDIRFKFSTASIGSNLEKLDSISEADIIHLHWINQGFLSLKTLKKLASLNKPIVWTLHDMWPFTGGCHHSQECTNYKKDCGNCKYLKKPKPHDISNKILAKKKEVFKNGNFTLVGVSDWIHKISSESALGKLSSLRKINNPINTAIFHSLDNKRNNQEIVKSEDKLNLTFVSYNLEDKKKGLSILIKALQGIDFNNLAIKIKLTLIGNLRDKKILDSIPIETNYKGLITEDTKLAETFQDSDIHISSSLEESLGYTAMEALGCGTPVIAFPSGGITDLVEDKKTGLIAKYNDVHDLRSKIESLIKDDKSRLKYGKYGAEKIKKYFNKTFIANQYLELYNNLLNKK